MKDCPTCKSTFPNKFVVCPNDGSNLVEVGVWAEGNEIRGKYRILSKVGQGGMGAVYKVLHVAFDELRALKVINPSLMSDELFVRRFKHEAVITRKLQHPNAVRVDDIDEAEDGRPIIVMEYIEGQSLKKLIKDQGALPSPRVCTIIKQAAAALDAAHKLGMVHRDIKPDNIALVDAPEGEQAKVLDFGIAKIKEVRAGELSGLTLTGTGVVIGTPQYMSPEQAMGKRGDELDGRSDIYSLGVVMYQMLTGDLPFKADTTMGMLIAHMQQAPTPIRTIHPELQIPEAIANVVMKTLEKDPGLRPQSARALIAEIENAESWAPPMNQTRVVRPTSGYSPEDSARALRESLQVPQTGMNRAAPPEVPPGPVAPVAPLPPPSKVLTPRRAPPRAAPAPQPHPVVAASPPRKSNVALWITMCALGVVLVAGGLYIIGQNSMRRAGNSNQKAGPITHTDSTEPKSSTDAPGSEQQGNDKSFPGSTGPGSAIGSSRRADSAGSPSSSRPPSKTEKSARRVILPAEKKPAVKVADQTRIAGAIKLGNFYYARGEYDSAITEYARGLDFDPTNAELRALLGKAKKAQAAERRVLR
jgi:serine/threonine protein kinase